jgi:hypothetical protein
MVFMIQQIPGRPDLAALFPTLVYSAMMGPAPW